MSELPHEERRQYSRVPFEADVTIIQDSHTFDAQLVDISLNGLLVNTPASYQIRTDLPCTVKISLADEVEIQMLVTLVHSSSSCLGFHCTSIDMDSMVHLRRVMEFNIEDPMAPDRVLAELVKKQQQASQQ